MIPKKIHYCWFGKNPLPNDVKKCIESWKKFCPDYEIIKWDEDNFDINSHPFTKAAYEAKAWAFVSDFVRLKVVYDNGGIYLDTDVELIKSLNFLLTNQCYVGIQQQLNLCNTGLGFGAAKNNQVLKDMIKEYDKIEFRLEEKAKISCPFLNTKVLTDLGYKYTDNIWYSKNITVYPCRYFDPYAPGDTSNLLCKDTISIHHYSASWTSSKNRLRRKLFRIIGNENIYKLKRILGKSK